MPNLAKRGGARKQIKICAKADAEREIEALEQVGGTFIAYGEADYPPLLGHTDGAPPLLTARDHTHLLSKRFVAVVGARNASLNARNFARILSSDLITCMFSYKLRGIDILFFQGLVTLKGMIRILRDNCSRKR